jgi:hypothetical protein
MRAALPRILLVGRNFTPSSQFVERLLHSDCACAFAGNLAEARVALRAGKFDLVLSEMTLPDGSAFPLFDLLESMPATLYFCVAVYNGCWWLPAWQRGRRAWGEAALRPAEFASALAELLGAKTLSRTMPSNSPAVSNSKIIPMPTVEIVPPRPRRVQPEEAKAQKSSA